jgi:hypothetical protein
VLALSFINVVLVFYRLMDASRSESRTTMTKAFDMNCTELLPLT